MKPSLKCDSTDVTIDHTDGIGNTMDIGSILNGHIGMVVIPIHSCGGLLSLISSNAAVTDYHSQIREGSE